MYLESYQIAQVGFKEVGKNVRISDKASFYNPQNISIGHETRIDDFVILSAGEGGIAIGNMVHIGCMATLIGNGLIRIGDYVEISGRVSIYSSTNDFSSEFYWERNIRTNILFGKVVIRDNVVIGCGSVILPKVFIGAGARIGALSLVKKDVQANCIYAGVPARKLKVR